MVEQIPVRRLSTEHKRKIKSEIKKYEKKIEQLVTAKDFIEGLRKQPIPLGESGFYNIKLHFKQALFIKDFHKYMSDSEMDRNIIPLKTITNDSELDIIPVSFTNVPKIIKDGSEAERVFDNMERRLVTDSEFSSYSMSLMKSPTSPVVFSGDAHKVRSMVSDLNPNLLKLSGKSYNTLEECINFLDEDGRAIAPVPSLPRFNTGNMYPFALLQIYIDEYGIQHLVRMCYKPFLYINPSELEEFGESDKVDIKLESLEYNYPKFHIFNYLQKNKSVNLDSSDIYLFNYMISKYFKHSLQNENSANNVRENIVNQSMYYKEYLSDTNNVVVISLTNESLLEKGVDE